jgi:hypothetical protein
VWKSYKVAEQVSYKNQESNHGDRMTEPDVVYRPLPRYSVPAIILVIILLITQCACGVAAVVLK